MLFHLHHRIERALGGSGIGTGYRFGQSDRRDLPGQSPFAPAALALFAAVADDRVPITISFGLVSGCDLKRERFVVLECGSAIEPEAGNPHHGKLYRQHIPFLPRAESLPVKAFLVAEINFYIPTPKIALKQGVYG